MEAAALVVRGRHGRQGGRHRPRPVDGAAGGGEYHRARGLARDHDLAASSGDERDIGGGGVGGRSCSRDVTATTATSFGAVTQIEAGPLDVGYVDAGPAGGPAVLLLHGWPYDIHSYEEVTPILASAGLRVIVPYLRGYGTTHFLSEETLRNGE